MTVRRGIWDRSDFVDAVPVVVDFRGGFPKCLAFDVGEQQDACAGCMDKVTGAVFRMGG